MIYELRGSRHDDLPGTQATMIHAARVIACHTLELRYQILENHCHVRNDVLHHRVVNHFLTTQGDRSFLGGA